MKKFFSVILSLVMALFGIGSDCNNPSPIENATRAAYTEVADLTEERKFLNWLIAYKAKCRAQTAKSRYNADKAYIRQKRREHLMAYAKRIVIMPLLPIIGAVGATTTEPTLFRVSYKKQGTTTSKGYTTLDKAKADYLELAKTKYPCVLESVAIAPAQVIACANGWGAKDFTCELYNEFRANVKRTLAASTMSAEDQKLLIDADMKKLNRAILARDVNYITELGVATKPSLVFSALRKVARFYAEPKGVNHAFTRLTLNNFSGSIWLQDAINKKLSPVEREAINLGGKDALIHVVSRIDGLDETEDISVMMHVEEMLSEWERVVDKGIDLNGKVYFPLGRGTNADKEVKSLWVREDILTHMKEWVNCQCDPNWLTSESKKTGYQTGLQSTPRHHFPMPFVPEDVLIVNDQWMESMIHGDNFALDMTHKQFDEMRRRIKTDGSMWIHLTEDHKTQMINRLVAAGVEERTAEASVREFAARADFSSLRGDRAAFKGGCDRNFDFHAFCAARGITHVPDITGVLRPIKDYCIVVTQSALKTPIGKNGAYGSVKIWCDAVRDGFYIGDLVREHKLVRKGISYQVIQALVEAGDENIGKWVDYVADMFAEYSTVAGAAKLLPAELRRLVGLVPDLMGIEPIRKIAEHKFYALLDEAFGGKIPKKAYYTFDAIDPVWAWSHICGIPEEAAFKSGEFHCGALSIGKEWARWRSPVINPNSIRVLKNVEIPKQYLKFFRNKKAAVAYLNAFDDVLDASDEDFDGDHGNYCDWEPIVNAAKSTLAKWDRLITWDEPEKDKHVVTDASMKEYWKSYVRPSEIGLTMYSQNALYTGIKSVKDFETGETYLVRVPINKDAINANKAVANRDVDKHRADRKNSVIAEGAIDPKAVAKYMVQPLAKAYRDKAFQKDAKLDIADVGFRADLDKLCENVPEIRRYQTLDKYYMGLCDKVDRRFHIDDLPEKVDVEAILDVLMFDKERSRRGLSGLIRNGKCGLVDFGGVKFRPDQGLFQYLSDGIERQKKERKDNAENRGAMPDASEVMQEIRAEDLCKVNDFAAEFGKYLEDAYDVIIWQMLKYSDSWFESEDGRFDFLKDRLWGAVRIIFGGMMIQAAEQNLGVETQVLPQEDEDDDWEEEWED